MRTPPPPPPPLRWKARKTDDRRYRFLTYVFGGGVKVKDHEKHGDTVTPVRVASIRGQLRFWWRACNPSGCETVEDLRRREGEVWGATGQASQVEIMVLSQPSRPQPVAVFEYNANRRLIPCSGMKEIAYGSFPLQPSRAAQLAEAQPWHLFDYGSSTFSLRFIYPDSCRKDVEAALWAWETFGGLGGRTRRGFGAIARTDSSPAPSAEAGLSAWREIPRIDGVPSLHQARFALAGRANPTAIDAWKTGLGLLQQIRQAPGFGRNHALPGSRKPAGRSRWPEPDEIRKLTKQSAPIHAKPEVPVSRFPRAAFGMPIVFHFHPGSAAEPGSTGDPKMSPLQLRPVGFERFASPLIIRPVADGRGFRAAALVLSSRIPAAELVAGNDSYPADFTLDPTLAGQIPALKRNGKVFTDPLELFLSELKK